MSVGVGDCLKRVFAMFFVKAKPECPCHYRASLMNWWGPDGCEEREQQIIEWMREAAASIHVPFSEKATSQLIRYCIWRSRKSMRKR